MSVPHFKERLAMKLDDAIVEFTTYLVEQQQADYAQLRAFQGHIAGLKQAREILSEVYKELY